MNLLKKYSLIIAILLLLFSLIIPAQIGGLLFSILILGILLLQPKNGLLFLLIYFPLRPFLLEMNDGLKYLGDIIIIGLFIYIIAKNVRNLKIFTKQWVFVVGFLGFCLVGAISALLTGVSITAVIYQLRAFVITFLLIFIMKGLKITKKDVVSFLWTTIIVAGVLCIQGIIEKVSGRTLLIPQAWADQWLPETNRIRIYSLIGNPNVFATYLVFSFFISIYLRKLNPKYRVLLTILSILFFGVFLLTYSRGTIIALIIGLIVYLIITKNWHFLKTVAISAILAVPLVYFPVVGLTNFVGQQVAEQPKDNHNQMDKETKPKEKGQGFTKRMSESFNSNTVQQSIEWGRLYVVKKGFEIFKENPIIGTGFGTYGDSASLNFQSPITEKYKLPNEMYSDNQYIQIIVQTGILGVLLFALFILSIIVLLWKIRKNSPFSLSLLAILIGGSVAGVFYNIWEDKTFTLYFFILFGFILNFEVRGGDKEELNS